MGNNTQPPVRATLASPSAPKHPSRPLQPPMALDHTRTTQSPVIKDITCKVCGRLLATVSTEGQLVPALAGEQACDTCRPFEDLHSAVPAKLACFKEFEDRRDGFEPKQRALEEAKEASKALDNFLIKIEAPFRREKGQNEEQSQYPRQDQGLQPRASLNPGEALKRSLPFSSPQPEQRPKRPHLVNDNTRRVSFDTALLIRGEDEKRPEQIFNRNAKEYVKGRYALPEGQEYLDTSGLGTTPTKFFGLKKKGKGWVETKEGREMDEQWRKALDQEQDHDSDEAEPHVVRQAQEDIEVELRSADAQACSAGDQIGIGNAAHGQTSADGDVRQTLDSVPGHRNRSPSEDEASDSGCDEIGEAETVERETPLSGFSAAATRDEVQGPNGEPHDVASKAAAGEKERAEMEAPGDDASPKTISLEIRKTLLSQQDINAGMDRESSITASDDPLSQPTGTFTNSKEVEVDGHRAEPRIYEATDFEDPAADRIEAVGSPGGHTIAGEVVETAPSL